MISDKKVQLLEIAREENALTLDYGLELYSSTSNVSRAIADLVERSLLIEKKPPKISNYRKVWVLSEQGEEVLEMEGKINKNQEEN